MLKKKRKRNRGGISLVAQCLRIRLPVQATQVRALVRDDPTCHRATLCTPKKKKKKEHMRLQQEAASASQGERPQEKANQPTPLFWTSSLQNCENINLYCYASQSVVFCYDSPSRWIQRNRIFMETGGLIVGSLERQWENSLISEMMALQLCLMLGNGILLHPGTRLEFIPIISSIFLIQASNLAVNRFILPLKYL